MIRRRDPLEQLGATARRPLPGEALLGLAALDLGEHFRALALDLEGADVAHEYLARLPVLRGHGDL